MIALSIISAFEPVAKGETPPGWLEGWLYRKKVTITGASGAGVGYQMMLRVRRGNGNDTGNTVYVGTKCREDFGDLRFADAEGNVFPYAITMMTSDEAIVWIKVNVDLNYNNNIYVYYGKSDAQSLSNVDATFIFAEPWNSATLNPRWTMIQNTVGNWLIDPGQNCIKFSGTGTAILRSSLTNIVFPSYYIVEDFYALQGETKLVKGQSQGEYVASDVGRAVLSIHNSNISLSDFGVAFWGFKRAAYESSHNVIAGVGHNIDYAGAFSYTDTRYGLIERTPQSKINITIGSSATSGSVVVSEYNIEAPNRLYIYYVGYRSSFYYYLYAFKIRKYVQPEPMFSTWYPEETAAETTAGLTVDTEPSWLSHVAFTLDYPQQILFAPYSATVKTGSHTVTVLDSKVTVNATHVYGFKCWKKNGEIVSYDPSYTFNMSTGLTVITLVYTAHPINIVSDPEMYVRLKVDEWDLQTPTTIYRGSGYYHFEVSDTQLYLNATHLLKFYGWYADNIYIGSDPGINIYISYATSIRIAYKPVEIPAPPLMTFKAQIVELGTLLAGTSRDFTITVIFDANAITIQSVEFTSKAEWLQVLDTLPIYATKGLEAIGTATINCRLTLPQNVQGYYTIPFKITAKTSQDITITTSSYLTFTATTTPTAIEAISTQPTPIGAGYMETITRIIGNPIILILLIALTIWLATYTIKKR